MKKTLRSAFGKASGSSSIGVNTATFSVVNTVGRSPPPMGTRGSVESRAVRGVRPRLQSPFQSSCSSTHDQDASTFGLRPAHGRPTSALSTVRRFAAEKGPPSGVHGRFLGSSRSKTARSCAYLFRSRSGSSWRRDETTGGSGLVVVLHGR
jgi:hypothetical protein